MRTLIKLALLLCMLFLAACQGREENEAYLDEYGKPYLPAEQLCIAAQSDDLDKAKKLVAQGVDPTKRYIEPNTRPGTTRSLPPPLHLATISEGETKVLRFFLENGADPNALDGDSMDYYKTPLYYAAFAGNLEAVKLLLDKGAWVEGQPGALSTPYLDAAKSNNIEVCRYLLENGADGAAKDVHGLTALILAIHQNDFTAHSARFYVENGSEPDTICYDGEQTPASLVFYYGQPAEIYEYLVSVGANQHFVDEFGNTPEDYYKGKPHPNRPN